VRDLKQGSEILHSVSEELAAPEPRMSLVNSYVATRPFALNKLKHNLYARNDGPSFVDYEHAQHRAWPAQGRLQHLHERSSFETTPGNLTAELRAAVRSCCISRRRRAILVTISRSNDKIRTVLTKLHTVVLSNLHDWKHF